MNPALSFKRAARTAIKIKIAVSGPSGSGKTLGALALAHGLGSRIALIDTENGSASTYSDRYAYDVLELGPPFTSQRFQDAIDAAVAGRFDVLVIDSLSHQWAGEGGILSRKEEADKRPGSNSYTNWAAFTKEHTAFITHVLHAPIHIIATLRSKHDYILETNDKGKQQPRKIGMAPVQREGLEYEFSTVFELQMDHRAQTSKDRTGLFADEIINLLAPETVQRMRAWLDSAPAVPVTAPVVAIVSEERGPTEAQIERMLDLAQGEDEQTRAKIERRITNKKVTEKEAAIWITAMELNQKGRTPAPDSVGDPPLLAMP